jgi:hypothetical protein
MKFDYYFCNKKLLVESRRKMIFFFEEALKKIKIKKRLFILVNELTASLNLKCEIMRKLKFL